MIASSRLGKLIALLLAGGAHGALALAFVKDEPIRIEGAAGAAEVRLGTAFADMAAGTLSAAEPTELTEPTPPEPARALPPQPVQQAETPPPEAVPQQPVEMTEAPSPEAQPTVPAKADPLPPAEPDTAVPALRPQAQQAEPVERLAALTPQPEPLKPVERPEPVKPIEAEPLKAEPPEKTVIKPQPKAKPLPKGNARTNARAGQTSGTERASATTSGSAGNSKEAGNAAASNYPGLVMRKLSRAPRPRINVRGAAVVAFRVSDGGGLAAVSIARSSGSEALDQAALRVVRRAAPFPAPPSGARRSFSVRIKGR